MLKHILAVAVVVFVAAVNNASAITITVEPGDIAAAIKHLKDGTVAVGSPPAGFTGLTAHVANEKAVYAQEAVVKENMLNNIDQRPQAIKDAMEFRIMTPIMTQLVREALKPTLQMDIARQVQPGL
jgi:hypothetical protein